MKVPKHVRDQVKERLWRLADELHWLRLTDRERAELYVRWSRDAEVADLLSRYMDRAEIRVYLKDSVMKPYPRERLADPTLPMQLLGLEWDGDEHEKHIKPHGVELHDGTLVCWGSADDWKAIVLACFERAWGSPRIDRKAVVMLNAIGAYADPGKRQLVEDVAQCLGIDEIVWDQSLGD